MRWFHSLVLGAALALSLGCGSSSSSSSSSAGGTTATGGHGGLGAAGGATDSGGTSAGGGQGGTGGEGGSGGVPSLGTSCVDSCTDVSVAPTLECGACLTVASGGVCNGAREACLADQAVGDCGQCGAFVLACAGGHCPPLDTLCASSRTLLDDYNQCLCAACGDPDEPVAPSPGFVSCDLPPLPTSPCTALGKADCLSTPGCRAAFADPCVVGIDCSPYVDFAGCLPVSGAATTPGACDTLDAAACEARDDCVTVHPRDTAPCCPAPSWSMPFRACIPEPTPPPSPVTCNAPSPLTCLAIDGCRPAFELLNTLAYCGPFLVDETSCPECWNATYMACLPSW